MNANVNYAVKKFYHAECRCTNHGINVINFFSTSLTLLQNKPECLSLGGLV
jgi:hypothetical protein